MSDMSVLPQRRLFTVEEYERIVEAGILGEDDHVELLDGEIVQMTPIGSRHAATVKRSRTILGGLLGSRAVIGVQDPVVLGDLSEPEPDLSVCKPRDDYYAARHPRAADVLLLIEVSDTSLDYDRDRKLPLYARYRIPETWIVDIVQQQIIVAREPGPDRYEDFSTVGRDGTISAVAFPDLVFEAVEILG
jgi:Uma2 family endonuclease